MIKICISTLNQNQNLKFIFFNLAHLASMHWWQDQYSYIHLETYSYYAQQIQRWWRKSAFALLWTLENLLIYPKIVGRFWAKAFCRQMAQFGPIKGRLLLLNCTLIRSRYTSKFYINFKNSSWTIDLNIMHKT